MKNNWITALTLGALLCLPACLCKKQCSTTTTKQNASTQVTEVAIKDSIDAFDANVIVLDEPTLIASQESAAKGSIKF